MKKKEGMKLAAQGVMLIKAHLICNAQAFRCDIIATLMWHHSYINTVFAFIYIQYSNAA